MTLVPARMGRLNMRSLVERLQRLGIASRAELAESLRMSPPTAGKIVDALRRLGVVEEISPDESVKRGRSQIQGASARPGRRRRILRLDRSRPPFGRVTVDCAPRRRIAGLVAAGIEHLVLPKVVLNPTTPAPAHMYAGHEA